MTGTNETKLNNKLLPSKRSASFPKNLLGLSRPFASISAATIGKISSKIDFGGLLRKLAGEKSKFA
jgi:hypothetical protein